MKYKRYDNSLYVVIWDEMGTSISVPFDDVLTLENYCMALDSSSNNMTEVK